MLPLHDNDQDEEPSSILIWGGYAEPTEDDVKAKYGDEADEFIQAPVSEATPTV